jgi:oligopeptide/dipeptide ABC transporter ATP-binding protein
MQLIRCVSLAKSFPLKSGVLSRRTGDVRAVDDVSISIDEGETLGVVGESGSGKSTLGRTILQLDRPTSGKVYFRGHDLAALDTPALREMRKHMQIVFQDPFSSLNPRYDVYTLISEPLEAHGIGGRATRRQKVLSLLELVQLGPAYADRFPHEMSGGQRQRVAIARALALEPDFLVLDEPVAALDVSIQAQIINLLRGLQQKLGLAYLFIAHDLSVVRHISQRVAVMYLGRIVELATRDSLFRNAYHPYTRALISAVPVADPVRERVRTRIVLKGDIPSSIDPPKACRFHTRCPFAQPRCRAEKPEWREISPDHWIECHFPLSSSSTPPTASSSDA